MGTRYRGTRTEQRALDAWIKLNRAVESVGDRLRAGATLKDVTVGQFAVLEVLRHVGPLNPVEIARRVLRSPANVTTVLDNLEREGWIERRRVSEDRRVVTVNLTVAGERVVDRLMPGHVQAITGAFGALTPEEQETLAVLCKKLGLANVAPGRI
jgi:MarR family 2-MHQ and catechol resistance regulon transcriptional repressor